MSEKFRDGKVRRFRVVLDDSPPNFHGGALGMIFLAGKRQLWLIHYDSPPSSIAATRCNCFINAGVPILSRGGLIAIRFLVRLQ